MVLYAKLNKDNQPELAAMNKDNILNYNLDVKRLEQDGYFELVECPMPNDSKSYSLVYELENGKIYQKWLEVELSYSQKRELEYPKLGDMIDAICKKLDGDGTLYDEMQNIRLAIKEKYPKIENSND